MPPTAEPSLQERFAPGNRCFGCGPANEKGLRIRSFPAVDDLEGTVVAEWTAEAHHEAFEGMLNGGIIGALLDCHSIWTAVWFLMQRDGLEVAPCCVTAEFHVTMKAPTPSGRPVRLSARVVESGKSSVRVEATLSSGDRATATCTGTFVAVKPGHPAHHRW